MAMKRILFTLILLALLFASAACASKNTEKSPAADSVFETEAAGAEEALTPLEQLEKKDFEGAVYLMYDGNDYTDTYQNIPGERITGDILNDGLFDRNLYIETNYHVTMQYEVMSSSQARANSSLEKGVNAICLMSSSGHSRSTRKKFTTSPSKSLYVSTGDGTLFSKTAPEPPKGSQ